MLPIENTVVPVVFFTTIVLGIYFTAKFKYQTRKAILEKGGDVEMIRRKFPFLEIGCTLLGLGVGLAIATIPQSTDLADDSKGLLVAASIVLFGGAGMLAAFFIRRKIDEGK